MNRRQFIVYSAAAVTSIVVGGTWHFRFNSGPANVMDVDDGADYAARLEHLRTVLDDSDLALILALVPRLESAAAIGAHVRSTDTTYRHEEVLSRDLKARLIGDDQPVDIDVDVVRRRLSDHVDRDFATGRTVMVDGWMLAESNTELYVLASFVHDRTGVADRAP